MAKVTKKKKKTTKKLGRATKYKPEYCEKIIEFFDREFTELLQEEVATARGDVVAVTKVVGSELPLFEAFAHEIGVHRDTLHEWTKVHPAFSDSYKRAKQLQLKHLVTNGLRGMYQNSFAIFTAKNIIGWRDRHDDAQVDSGGNITVTFKQEEK